MADHKEEPDLVVISRVHEFLAGHSRRIYARGNFVTEDASEATQMPRERAEKLLASGRWHGLDPRIEVAP